MSSDRLVAALDIGSAYTTALIAEVTGELPRRPTLKVLGVGTMQELSQSNDPVIREYFQGPRGRAAQEQAAWNQQGRRT